MSYRVLMIYPEIPVTYWSFKYILKLVGRRAAFPPLGLLTVAALLPERYDVTLVDMNTTRLQRSDIVKADIIFISAMMIQKESFDRVVARCKTLGKTVVAGGPYPTGSHAGITGVDHFVLGEAEVTLPMFLSDWERGAPLPVYQSDERPDITKTPIPRFDLVKHRHYTTMSLQYSRGCPFNCEFCDIIELFGRVPRTKEPEQFLAELNGLYRTGYRGPLFIVDDNFIGNKGNVKKLLPAIARWQKERSYPFMINTEASVNLADDEELMDMMVEAGFNKVFLGIETPVEESLEQAGKSQNTRGSLLAGVERIQRKGMEVSAGFIVGFDSDPENVFDLQMDFIRKSGIPLAMAGLLLALPNTRLYRRLASEGRIIREASGNNTHCFHLNFTPVMDRELLVKGYKTLISRIYSPQEYFNRCLTLMSRIPKGRVGRGAISFWTVQIVVRIFLSSLAVQIFSSYGRQYLQYLSAAMRIKKGMFPKAVKMALYGHHFFRMTKELVAVDELSASIEKIRQSLRSRIERFSFDRLDDALRDVFALDHGFHENALIARIEKKYRRLHGDFRDNVEEPMKKLMDEFHVYIEMVVQSMRNRLEGMIANGNGSIHELKEYCAGIKQQARKRYLHLNRDLRAYYCNLLEFFNRRIDMIVVELESRYGLSE
jgi:radical SAM superfamily enzyme YgiQ (UPF0313 family)